MIADVSTIVARGMGIRRRRRWILRPAVFGVTRGVIGFAGPPGTGKTTLLATFATLRRPNTGALEILGYDTGDPAVLRSVRAQIGYLPDDFSWAADMRVGEFIAYTAFYKCAPATAVDEVMERFELGDVAAMELRTLSYDMRLRAGLAATCVHGPRLVLLDEPFAGNDGNDGKIDKTAELWAVIRSLAPAVLITAPTADRLIGHCDQVFTLARGRLTEPFTTPSAVPARRCRRTGRRSASVVGAHRLAAMSSSRPQRIGAGV